MKLHLITLVILASTAVFAAEPGSGALGAPGFLPTPEQPMGWRGDGSGHYPGATPPTKWSRTVTAGKPESSGILFMTPIPGGGSSPIVVGDRIFVGFDPYGLMCISKTDGHVLWYHTHSYYEVMPDDQRKTIEDKLKASVAKVTSHMDAEIKRMSAAVTPAGFPDKKFMTWEWAQQVTKDQKLIDDALIELDKDKYKSNHNIWEWASATPVCDGKFVYMWYSHRVAVCYDLDGNRQWVTIEPGRDKSRDKGSAEHGRHSSPVLAADKFIVQYGSEMIAFDRKTGKMAWTKPMTQTPPWCTPEYSSLVLAHVAGQPYLVNCMGEGFRAADGERGWGPHKDYAGENASSVVDHDRVFVWDRKGIFQIKIPATPSGAAATEGKSSPWKDAYMVATPLCVNGLVYCVSDKGKLRVFDADAGTVAYEKDLPIKGHIEYVWYPGFSASPALAGQYVYITDNQGGTLVLEAGREYKEVSVNKIETFDKKNKEKDGTEKIVYEQTVSNPAFDGKLMFLRGQQYLYCIGSR